MNVSDFAATAHGSERRQRFRHVGLLAGMALALMVGLPVHAQGDAANGNADGAAATRLAPIGSALSLDTITVTSSTASGYAIDVQNAPASVSVVTQEELQQNAYRDVQAALRDVPGVYLNSSPTGKGGSGEISLRGMDSKFTLILVNGIPQRSDQMYYNGYGQGSEFGWLPPVTAIERIEVIRGPMSTLYGSAALGGVINIITKPVADEWSGTVDTGATFQENPDSGNYYQTSLSASGPLVDDVLGLRFSADVFQRKEDDIASGYAGYLRRNANIGLDWVVNDNNQLSVELGFGRQDTHAGAKMSSSRGNDMDLRTERTSQTVRHELEWGERWTTRSYLQHARVDMDSGYQSRYERTTVNTETVLPFSDHLFTLGAQYRLQQIMHDPDRALGAEGLERWDAALYAEHQWFMTQDFTLTWGLRYVYDEFYGGELVPRIYGVYKLTPQLSLKGGVSAGYRTPNLKQGDSFWVEGGCGDHSCRDVGNSELQPESSVTYEAGLYYQSTKGLRTSITLFHTDFDNKIAKQEICESSKTAPTCMYLGEGPFPSVNQYVNVSEARVNGVEFAIDVPVTPTFDVSASYTYTDSERQSGENEGFPLSDQPEHLVTLGLDWQPRPDTSVWLNTRIQSETLEVPGRGDSIDESRPGYGIVDVGANYQFDNGFVIYGGVYNVLDKDITIDEFDRILDGRRYNIGVRYSF